MRLRDWLVTGMLLAAAPTRAGDAPGAFTPYEDLIEVVAGLTWHLRDDIYRFPPPRDPTGHDLYRLTLRRLDAWEKRYPNRLHDVTLYARAETLERLGEYHRAADGYRQVTLLPSPLGEPARQALDRIGPFVEAAALPEDASSLEDRLAALRRKLDAWGNVIQRQAGTPYESLALVEEERLERVTASLVIEHRRELKDGNATAERSLRFLVEKHADSKNLPSHILRLGDLYADLTYEYVADHERPLVFDEDEFVQRADRALDTYRKVATWDGAREKPEAQGRFAALDAYKSAVLSRYR